MVVGEAENKTNSASLAGAGLSLAIIPFPGWRYLSPRKDGKTFVKKVF